MAWTAPATAVAGGVFTAAMWNATIRDNLNAGEAALATASAQTFVATGVNTIVARRLSSARVDTSQTTASTTYVDLTTVGPSVTVTTGTSALIIASATMASSTANAFINVGYAVSGSTTIAATSNIAILNYREAFLGGAADQVQMSGVDFLTNLTPGSNTFTLKYSTSSGTATFVYRTLVVWPF